MKATFTFLSIMAAIGVLFFVANTSVSTHAVPTLSEFIASTTANNSLATYSEGPENQANWLASSTIIEALLSEGSKTSSTKNAAAVITSVSVEEKASSSSQKTTQSGLQGTQISTRPASTSLKITPTPAKVVLTPVKVAATSSQDSKEASSIPITTHNSSLLPVKTKKSTLYVTVAKNPTTREKGLSGYPSLDANEGMLFIFPTPGEPEFWMKDMNFPIDIVWMDRYKKIVGVTSNVSPRTYPETFLPPGKIQFVLEVNAGSTEKLGLTKGTTVVF